MHTFQFEITKPTDDSAFEDMCARVYGDVFEDRLAKINGRQGQAQAGIDVFVNSANGRIGIQCKKYADGTLKLKHVKEELARADKANVPIVRLVVATTAASDSTLVREVQDLSDAREKLGQFPVCVEFWEEICRHIRGSGKLSRDYAPNAPGAMFDRIKEEGQTMLASIQRIEASLTGSSLPSGRPESVDKLISSQLDEVNDFLKSCRYKDALERLGSLGANLTCFDEHQKARWHLQRGICRWHLGDLPNASADMLLSAELFPDDDKIAAGKVRGLVLADDVSAALEAGTQAVLKHPTSVHIWLAVAHAKLISGSPLLLDETPIEMRDNCDVLQLLAWSQKQSGNTAKAVEIIKLACQKADAGFFVRRSALALTLDAAASDPLKFAFGAIPANELADVAAAAACFSPRKEKLWSIQSPESLEELAGHLGYAYLVLGQEDEALNLLEEAKHEGFLPGSLMRMALETYRRLGRTDDVLRYGKEWLTQLPPEALASVAEIAGGAGDFVLAADAVALLEKATECPDEALNVATANLWIAKWHSSEHKNTVLNEVRRLSIAEQTSIPLLCAVARILSWAGDAEKCELILAKLKELAVGASSAKVLMVGDLFFSLGQHALAAKYYEPNVARGYKSELHIRLLNCYLHSGARRKARDLIASLPVDWATDDELRGMALELGQHAADWDFLVPLAEIQVSQRPLRVGGWLLKLVLDLKRQRMHAFHQSLEALPLELEGTAKQIAQLASLEFAYDRKESGLKRLYRQFRNNLDDYEAASAYFIGIIAGPGDLPFMDESLSKVTAGSTVELEDEHGAVIQLSIDIDDGLPVPARNGFYAGDNADIKSLLGAEVEASVLLPGGLGTEKKYKIKSITTVFRHLLAVAQEQFKSSVGSGGSIVSLSIPTTEDGADFTEMHEMLKRTSEHSRHVIEAYKTSPITLGITAKLLGRPVLDIAQGWPNEAGNLFVCRGTHEERLAALQKLAKSDGIFVVDSLTLAELAWLDCVQAIKALPEVYCSSVTLEVIGKRLDEVKQDTSRTTIFDDGGVMRLVEKPDWQHEKELNRLEAMMAVATSHCKVVPAYGPAVLSDELAQAEQILSCEEYSALLLCLEKGATLVTLDGRLAQFAAGHGISSVWPQALLQHSLSTSHLPQSTYSLAAIHEFIGNRDFVSLAAVDLVLMCQQGGFYLQIGLQRLKNYLSKPTTEYESAVVVVFEFLQGLLSQRIQFKAFSELFSHLIEALLRHPTCKQEELLSAAAQYSVEVSESVSGTQSPFEFLNLKRDIRIKTLQRELYRALQAAFSAVEVGNMRKGIKLKTLMCTAPPVLIFDDSVVEQTGAEIVEAAQPRPLTGAEGPSHELSAV